MNFVFDIDGTLRFDGRTIALPITQALTYLIRAHHKVVFASARPIRDLLPIIPEFEHQPLIGGNGVMTRVSEKLSVLQPLPPAAVQQLKQLIEIHHLDYVMDGTWNYASQVSTDNPILRQLDPQRLAQRQSLASLNDPVKVILLNLAPVLRARIKRLLITLDLVVIEHSGEGSLDITAQGINKAHALANIGFEHYIAFGNDENDRIMLGCARQAVWITSKPELAPAPQAIICPPDAESIAALISNLSDRNDCRVE